jgi:hypothetical protein
MMPRLKDQKPVEEPDRDESATYDASAFPNPDEQTGVADSRCQSPDPEGE